ncbi:MAG: anti-sigma factor antagonist [Prolixibacteraceae bacterium]|nr:anti-sigma factor antagonist [Prolixibacteraceae bacterium]
MFSISSQNYDSILCVIPEGRLDTINSAVFMEKMQGLVDNEKYLILDFSLCNYLSSTGIRVLLSSAKKLKATGGNLFLANVSDEVLQVIEMTGLVKVFNVSKTVSEAKNKILESQKEILIIKELSIEDHKISIQTSDNIEETVIWQDKTLAGYNELGISAGIGSPAESLTVKEDEQGIFVTVGNFSGFIPFNKAYSTDFRVLKDHSQGGIYVDRGISVSTEPKNILKVTSHHKISLKKVIDVLQNSQVQSENKKLRALILADVNKETSSLVVCFQIEKDFISDFDNTSLKKIQVPGLEINDEHILLGIRILLSELKIDCKDCSFRKIIAEALSIENIEAIDILDSNIDFNNPIVWFLNSDKVSDSKSKRIKVELPENFTFEYYKEFLTRRLYTDSLRVVVKPLHGGYSAQTFQVESFDYAGRKLRPTVMKIANKDIIRREATRCSQYSLPYIINNSAIILGTEFFGEMGALRYNFVGIGGEKTQLKWLTYYYNSCNETELSPLFDKIFLQILKPWYGQPVKQNIFPFKDHDPTLTFFGTLCKTAEEVLSVSSDDKYVTIEETGDVITNPYWYLKYEYERLREWGMEYYTSICHGDLNMQNILLDQDMNVYIIDFSETKPRSVVSDFARLEAIFMCEHLEPDNLKDMNEIIQLILKLYDSDSFNLLPAFQYSGKYSDELRKNVFMANKMRSYALNSSNNDENIIPYYIALLEWVLPIVCYWGAPLQHKKISMIVAGVISGKLMKVKSLSGV